MDVLKDVNDIKKWRDNIVEWLGEMGLGGLGAEAFSVKVLTDEHFLQVPEFPFSLEHIVLKRIDPEDCGLCAVTCTTYHEGSGDGDKLRGGGYLTKKTRYIWIENVAGTLGDWHEYKAQYDYESGQRLLALGISNDDNISKVANVTFSDAVLEALTELRRQVSDMVAPLMTILKSLDVTVLWGIGESLGDRDLLWKYYYNRKHRGWSHEEVGNLSFGRCADELGEAKDILSRLSGDMIGKYIEKIEQEERAAQEKEWEELRWARSEGLIETGNALFVKFAFDEIARRWNVASLVDVNDREPAEWSVSNGRGYDELEIADGLEVEEGVEYVCNLTFDRREWKRILVVVDEYEY